MSHIYIYSPSSAQRDKSAFRRGVARLQALGHEVEVDPDALATHMRFAGDDTTRLAAVHRAAASGADVAMISRGGYGLTRILPGIRTKALARAIERGTRFVGFSDFTALQCALYAQTGAVSWMGPVVNDDFGRPEVVDDIMQACLEDLLAEQGEGSGWQLPRVAGRKPDAADARADKPLLTRPVRNAVLWGGNLSVLVSLVGTPYFPQVQGGVLVLEDVAEHPYRIERMLTQLLHAGVLAKQKAIVLGQFTQYQLAPNDKGYKLQTAIDWLRGQLKVPVLTNLPMGHVPTKVVLPFGLPVDLLVDGRDALIYWGHAH
ncbi:LD-carboxypeptidase [Comamonadaceae bacterium G21597-S1]|nr:LD-carboxypeptidase [Comamonadaceae bacterium G21597-S1]